MSDICKSMNEESEYQTSSGYVVREIAGEFLLIPVKMQEDMPEQIAIMNETGKFLWELMAQGSTVEAMLQALTEEYEVSEEDARRDIQDFLSMLKTNKLLQKCEGE